MPDIKIIMKNGEIKDFPQRERPGGSWANSVRYEGAFVIVEDVWGKETAFPAAGVALVEKEAEPGRR